MRATVNEMLEMYAGLNELAEKNSEAISPATNLKVARLLRQLRVEAELFQDARKRLIEKHGTPNEKGAPEIDLQSRAGMAFSEELRGVLQSETELPLQMLEYDDLGNPGAAILAKIYPLLANVQEGE